MRKFRKFERREDKYTGIISDRDGKIWHEFKEWLGSKLVECGEENVTVIISRSEEQRFKGIETKEVKELEYSEEMEKDLFELEREMERKTKRKFISPCQSCNVPMSDRYRNCKDNPGYCAYYHAYMTDFQMLFGKEDK